MSVDENGEWFCQAYAASTMDKVSEQIPSARGVLIACNAVAGQKGLIDSKGARREDPDLGTLLLNAVEDGVEGRLAETTVKPGFLVVLEASAEPFRAIIEGVSKWFVNAFQIGASHKHLQRAVSNPEDICTNARSVLFQRLSSRRGGVWP